MTQDSRYYGSSSSYDDATAFFYVLERGKGSIYQYRGSKAYGLSVRCLKNVTDGNLINDPLLRSHYEGLKDSLIKIAARNDELYNSISNDMGKLCYSVSLRNLKSSCFDPAKKNIYSAFKIMCDTYYANWDFLQSETYKPSRGYFSIEQDSLMVQIDDYNIRIKLLNFMLNYEEQEFNINNHFIEIEEKFISILKSTSETDIYEKKLGNLTTYEEIILAIGLKVFGQ